MSEGGIVASFVVPVHPHTVLAPDQNPGWRKLRDAYDDAAATIKDLNADLIIIYSTTWPSILGHQIQADPNPEWVLVDHDFHDLGSISYRSTSMLNLPTRGTTQAKKGACRADVSTTRASRLT